MNEIGKRMLEDIKTIQQATQFLIDYIDRNPDYEETLILARHRTSQLRMRLENTVNSIKMLEEEEGL